MHFESGPSLCLCSGPCCFPGRLFLVHPSTSSFSPVQSILHIITLETFSKTNLYSTVFQVCLHIVASLSVLAENPSFSLWHSGNNLTTNNFSNVSQQCSNAQSCFMDAGQLCEQKPSFPARVVLHISFLQCSSWILQLTNSYSLIKVQLESLHHLCQHFRVTLPGI